MKRVTEGKGPMRSFRAVGALGLFAVGVGSAQAQFLDDVVDIRPPAGIAAGGGAEGPLGDNAGTQSFQGPMGPGTFASQFASGGSPGVFARSHTERGINRAEARALASTSSAYAGSYWAEQFRFIGGPLGTPLEVDVLLGLEGRLAGAAGVADMGRIDDELNEDFAFQGDAAFRLRTFKFDRASEVDPLDFDIFPDITQTFLNDTGAGSFGESPVVASGLDIVDVRQRDDNPSVTLDELIESPFLFETIPVIEAEWGDGVAFGVLLEVWAENGGYADFGSTAEVTAFAFSGTEDIDGPIRFESSSGFDWSAIPATYNGEPVTLSEVPLPGAVWGLLAGLGALGLTRRLARR
jgi:hypothetical protein